MLSDVFVARVAVVVVVVVVVISFVATVATVVVILVVAITGRYCCCCCRCCCFSSQHNRLGYLYKHMSALFVEVVESVLLLDIINGSLIVRGVVELMKAVLLAVLVMAVWSVVSLGAVLPVV